MYVQIISHIDLRSKIDQKLNNFVMPLLTRRVQWGRSIHGRALNAGTAVNQQWDHGEIAWRRGKDQWRVARAVNNIHIDFRVLQQQVQQHYLGGLCFPRLNAQWFYASHDEYVVCLI